MSSIFRKVEESDLVRWYRIIYTHLHWHHNKLRGMILSYINDNVIIVKIWMLTRYLIYLISWVGQYGCPSSRMHTTTACCRYAVDGRRSRDPPEVSTPLNDEKRWKVLSQPGSGLSGRPYDAFRMSVESSKNKAATERTSGRRQSGSWGNIIITAQCRWFYH